MPGLLDTFKQKATAVKDYLYPPAPNGMNWWEYAQQRANDPLQPNLSSRITQQDLVNKGLNLAGLAPVGMVGRAKTKYEIAHDIASKNAEKMLGLPKGNTAMQRAKVLSYDLPAYHATRSDVKALDPSKAQFAREGSGTWLSENPQLANTYAGTNGGNVMPLLVNTKKYGEIDALKQNWNKIPADEPIRHANQTDSAMAEYLQNIFDDVGSTNLAANISRLNGDDGLRVFNVRDVGGYMSGVDDIPELADNLAVFNPSTVRSRFAAFDPARIHEDDLLAGIAPYLGVGGLLGLGMYGNQDRMTD